MSSLSRPQAISFDCAQTLLWVDWEPVRLVCQSATDMGFGGDSRAAEIYGRLLKSRWGEYLTLNEAGNEDATDAWWARLGQDWVREVGWPEDAAAIIAQRATAKLYGPNADVFGLFPDTLPTLEALKERGVRMAVVSNWDISLDRTLRAFGIDQFFEVTVASMVVNSEKPDPGIFQHALGRLGVAPEEVWHVGDDAVADAQGARQVGIRSFLIDREFKGDSPFVISSLSQLIDHLDACD
ncbi:MAG TPA: HAD-IA family hydrolase [Fimbriimonadaceae bacterium]|nr:HAD-IA family hydrolase [Fimbriimonadaceae bacterium]HRE95055.1 HAD-IA family hydrolase [Fimbriimonadaceae bacterium]HRI74758.1 HAD-IA family hydrolase [Fimbriimonadaceae bacterium]